MERQAVTEERKGIVTMIAVACVLFAVFVLLGMYASDGPPPSTPDDDDIMWIIMAGSS